MGCKTCDRDLYLAFERMDNKRVSFVSNELPLYPKPNITIPIDRLKEFNVDYHALAEFAALVCGVKVETLCKFDMIEFLIKRMEDETN